jgi:hypothetical protein
MKIKSFSESPQNFKDLDGESKQFIQRFLQLDSKKEIVAELKNGFHLSALQMVRNLPFPSSSFVLF